MKQVFFKGAFLVVAFAVISAVIGNIRTNACDRKLSSKTCLRQKQALQKVKTVVGKETSSYPDIILTNAVLRF